MTACRNWRGVLLGVELLLISSLPAPVALVAAQDATRGRLLGSTRGQVAWLDLLAPRPTPLTQLARPAYPADVAAASGVPFAVASIVGAFSGGSGGIGGDLLLIDLTSGASRTLLARTNDSESLDLPALWPNGSGIVYQRSSLRAAVPMPGQAQPQHQSLVEQISPDGSVPVFLLDDARYPGPSPRRATPVLPPTADTSRLFARSSVERRFSSTPFQTAPIPSWSPRSVSRRRLPAFLA